MSWDYTAPIGGEFFFPPSQRGQFGQHMAKGVLIGLLHITGSHMLKPDFFSLTGLAVCTPFLSSARMQLLLEAGIAVGFLIFQLSDFLRQNATFVFAENKCKCICQAVHFIFLLCRGSPIRVSPNGGRPFSGAQKVVVFTLAA